MREIKFRAWDRVNNIMVHDVGINDGKAVKPGYQLFSMENSVFNAPVMQSTGLKDKNGEEIYEGDIVQLYRHNTYIKAKIEWSDDGAFEMISGDEKYIGSLYFNTMQIEVIGNIYENPELLKNDGQETSAKV